MENLGKKSEATLYLDHAEKAWQYGMNHGGEKYKIAFALAACELYRTGLARKLVVSGGPGDGAVHETESMRRMAVSLGVRSDDILLDPAGLNTRATAKNTELLLTQLNASRVLVVSHFYHLPRIKLAFQQDGWDVFTVPARESYILRQLPFNMLREIAAFWAYYFTPLTQRTGRG